MQNYKLFGFTFGKTEEQNAVSPISREDDASIKIDANDPGFISPQINSVLLDNTSSTENDLIAKYRDISIIPEVNQCVEEIVSEMVIQDTDDLYVTLNLDKLELSDSIKDEIIEEFENVYSLLMFSRKGHDIARRWYIDGRLNYQVVIDNDAPTEGITALRFVDPRKIKKVRESVKYVDEQTGIVTIKGYREYFIFNERGVGSNLNTGTQPGIMTISSNQDVMIPAESIVYVPSGLTDPNQGFTISYLNSALRAANNLRMVEDAGIIYTLVRAPERRVFLIDTGNLTQAKANQYVQEIADKNKTKVVYDANTGEIRNDRRFMAMTEDYWLPRKGGSRGTEIQTLPGGNNMGNMEQTEYFKDKLYTALKVPKSRFSDQPTVFSSGSQVTRDEIRFSRFINQLRTKFSVLFEELLGKQLILKKVFTPTEWAEYKVNIDYEFAEDSHFAESIKLEQMMQRANALNVFDNYVGKYLSRDYVYKEILNMNEDEAREQQKLIEKESAWHEGHAAFAAAKLGNTPEDPIELPTAVDGPANEETEYVIESILD